jgi:hypothetical protein
MDTVCPVGKMTCVRVNMGYTHAHTRPKPFIRLFISILPWSIPPLPMVTAWQQPIRELPEGAECKRWMIISGAPDCTWLISFRVRVVDGGGEGWQKGFNNGKSQNSTWTI